VTIALITLNSNPIHQALSYKWGKLGTEKEILLDGKPFKVREYSRLAL
jgi:hypothetical protein